MLTTTFALAKKGGACEESYKKFAKNVGGITKYGRNTPIPLTDILGVLGLRDALWCLWVTPKEQDAERDKLARIFACDCAEHVLHIYEKAYPNDNRPRKAITAARLYTEGKATTEERAAAGDAAWAAASAAAWDTARAAAGDAEKGWQTQHFRELLKEVN